MSSRSRSIVAWILRVVLALFFTAAAVSKLAGGGDWVTRFADWGYAPWFMYLTGVLELVGAVGLLIPRTARHAALGLTVIMVGAALTHLMAGEWDRIVVNGGYVIALVGVWWLLSPRPEVSTQTPAVTKPTADPL